MIWLSVAPAVKKVVFSDSPADVDFTFVFGVNEDRYDPQAHYSIAASICDVVGIGPAINKLYQRFGITSGFVTTLHPWLAYQNIMDSRPVSTAFMDKPWSFHAMGRASVGSLIPKNTSVIPAMERAIPELKGKLNGMSFRVPTEIVSTGIVNLNLEKKTHTEEVRQFLKSAVRKPYLDYTEEPLVSVDYKHNENSCIVDGKWIEVIDGYNLRMVSWYDNEWGYSNRAIEIVKFVSERL